MVILVDFEDDLPKSTPLFQQAMSLGCAPERKDPIHDGAQLLLPGELENPKKVALRAHGGAKDLDLPKEDLA